jgi:hypothetical protein
LQGALLSGRTSGMRLESNASYHGNAWQIERVNAVKAYAETIGNQPICIDRAVKD